MSRTELTAWITVAFLLAMCGFASPDERPRAPIPRAPLPSPVEPTEPATPTKPTEQSDLHSHLCSNPYCLTDGKRTEWWHDPRKGPVSHNCPKCGREQYVINQSTPSGARSTSPPAASLQQVVRAPDSDTPSKQKTVYVVGSTYCGACVAFHKKHGDGNEKTRYVYAQMDKSRPSDIPGTVWNEIVRHNNTLSFTWPFFVVERDGKFIASQERVE